MERYGGPRAKRTAAVSATFKCTCAWLCVANLFAQPTVTVALPYQAVTISFQAGYEPFRSVGERGTGIPRPCVPGFYKAHAGPYPCTRCPLDAIAPIAGATGCTKCSSLQTADSTHTLCVEVNGAAAASARALFNPRMAGTPTSAGTESAVAPTKSTSLGLSNSIWKERATKAVQAAPCSSEENGAQRCGIPIGYWDNNRTGTVFFPQDYKNTKMPYMLLLHGAGWTGSDMINIFKDYAIRYKFAIIAPDSHNPMYWSDPATAADPPTADFYHLQACWDAVMKFDGVVVDPNFITSFGNSRASYSAVSYASRSNTNFNSAAILHAAALPQQMGPRVFPILWVTGSRDPLYGPVPAKIDVANFRRGKPQYDISWQVWIDNHTIRNYTQIDYMIKWWLTPSLRSNPIQTY